ncbi:MAG: hypothetical protein ACREVY_13670 [Gammaproteobacteria bacterium]
MIPIVHMVFLLSSCGTTGSVVERRAITIPPSGQLATLDLERNGPKAEVDVPSLLAYVRWLRAQSREAQKQELRRVEDTFAREYSPLEQLRLGLLLLLPKTSFKDEARARQLLRRLSAGRVPQEYLGLSELLLVLLDERDAQDQAYARLQHRWQAEQNQRWTLQRQLNAIKAIEKTITERKRPPALPLDDVE